jgi:hypothetical protein
LGFAGPIYGATAVVCAAILPMLALQVGNRGNVDRRAARRLFAFSIFRLFLLFAALLIGSSSRGSVCSGLAPAQPVPGSHRKPAKSRIQQERALWFCNHFPRNVISSPSCRNTRRSPFGSTTGCVPPAVNSSMLLGSAGLGPEMVPVPIKSPGCRSMLEPASNASSLAHPFNRVDCRRSSASSLFRQSEAA